MARRIFGIGETVLDIAFKGSQPISAKAGGSVLNAMVSLARTGHEVQFISELGDDSIGDSIIEFLQKNKVGQHYVTRYPNGQTPLALAFLNDANDATYEFYKPYPATRTLNLPNDLTDNDIVLFGSFYAINGQVRPFVKELIDRASNAGSLIIYDPNFRPAHSNEPELKQRALDNIAQSHLVRGSDEDFKNLFGIKNQAELASQISKLCPYVVATNGANGIDLISPNYQCHFDVDKIAPLSTIGAGDNFNAGLIKAIVDLNITASKINHCTNDEWNQLVSYGKEFSKAVCLSTDNYVDDGFIFRLPLLLRQCELTYEWKWGKEE